MPDADVISFARGAPSLDIVDIDGLKASILEAVNMEPTEAKRRLVSMRRNVQDHDVARWSRHFLTSLQETQDDDASPHAGGPGATGTPEGGAR